jgi:prophage regulatory protein
MSSKFANQVSAKNQQHIPVYIREAELLSHLPFSRATLWRKVRDGSFVVPVKLGTRITAWNRTDVLAWLEEKGGAV